MVPFEEASVALCDLLWRIDLLQQFLRDDDRIAPGSDFVTELMWRRFEFGRLYSNAKIEVKGSYNGEEHGEGMLKAYIAKNPDDDAVTQRDFAINWNLCLTASFTKRQCRMLIETVMAGVLCKQDTVDSVLPYVRNVFDDRPKPIGRFTGASYHDLGMDIAGNANSLFWVRGNLDARSRVDEENASFPDIESAVTYIRTKVMGDFNTDIVCKQLVKEPIEFDMKSLCADIEKESALAEEKLRKQEQAHYPSGFVPEAEICDRFRIGDNARTFKKALERWRRRNREKEVVTTPQLLYQSE